MKCFSNNKAHLVNLDKKNAKQRLMKCIVEVPHPFCLSFQSICSSTFLELGKVSWRHLNYLSTLKNEQKYNVLCRAFHHIGHSQRFMYTKFTYSFFISENDKQNVHI